MAHALPPARLVPAARPALLALLLSALSGACDSPAASGALGLVNFTASACGAAAAGFGGCDPKLPVALGATVSLSARPRQGGPSLALRSSDEAVLSLVAREDGDGAVATGRKAGSADLWALEAGKDRDRLPVTVLPIGQFAYSQLSDPSGAFTATPGEDADGTFEVTRGLKRFGLILAALSEGGQRLLGRDGARYTLPQGLVLSQSPGDPAGLYFQFDRPEPGSYPLLVEAREGGVRAKILIIVSP